MGVSEKAIISANQITDYIPQRAPIVMIDTFFGVEESVSISGLTIKEDNIFCEAGELNECGIIEHIAQSAAMRVGYLFKESGKDIPLGFIGSVNKFRAHCSPKVGEVIRTEIAVEQEVMNITLISAAVKIDDKLVAECKMKIYLQQ